MTRTTNDGRKHGARCVITSEPSLHQTGAVITHQGSCLFVVAHGVSSETHMGARAGNQVAAPLVQVMKFSIWLDKLIGDTDFSQHKKPRQENNNKKKNREWLLVLLKRCYIRLSSRNKVSILGFLCLVTMKVIHVACHNNYNPQSEKNKSSWRARSRCGEMIHFN